MGEWPRVRLGDVCRETTVGHVGPMADKYIDEGVPFLRSLSVEPFRVKTDGLKFIGPEFHAELKKSALRPGDVVIVRTGKPGACAVVPDWLGEANCSDLVIARCGPRLRPRFLSYVVNSVGVQHIEYHLVGAVQQHFNVGSARSLEFGLPEITEQDLIVELLGSIDDKIDLNRRMNETLEAMARAIFKDWFVDFAPTRAKAEGRVPYLAPELWGVFPDALNEEGRPVGWESKPLDEIAEFLNGLALQKFPALDPDDSLPVIKIAELRGGIKVKSSRASREVPEKYVVKDGDFLFSWSGSLLAKFWTEGEGALNQHLFKVSSDRYPAWFFSQWVRHHLEEFQAIAASKATTMGHIQRGHLKEAMTNCPRMMCFPCSIRRLVRSWNAPSKTNWRLGHSPRPGIYYCQNSCPAKSGCQRPKRRWRLLHEVFGKPRRGRRPRMALRARFRRTARAGHLPGRPHARAHQL